MSISKEEAWNQFPDEESDLLDIDDARYGYVLGREAKPCAEQVEAGAIALFEKETNFSAGVDHTEDDVRDAWTHTTDINLERFRELAEAVLDAARKAVM